MKVIDILNKSDKAVFSFELVPPLRGGDINKIYEAIEPLIALAPPFINITFHRDEVEYRELPDGTIKKVTVTKRPGTVALAAAIMRRYNVDMVPHIVCGGATRHKIPRGGGGPPPPQNRERTHRLELSRYRKRDGTPGRPHPGTAFLHPRRRRS
ncbi:MULTISPECIES: methylenetetrahydrofolate reductase [Butyricimonas]|uniref:methylenetetrahydrofolate reductase n=1 Tax=Butyricimonas TaxID=574697 RepID=UPI00292A45FD|nr:methylenetetrahydrofolate reductase [Butyricimonas synergistica]